MAAVVDARWCAARSQRNRAAAAGATAAVGLKPAWRHEPSASSPRKKLIAALQQFHPGGTTLCLPASTAASALACADHAQDIVVIGKSPQHPQERATERVAVLMTPTEKAAYADRAHSLGLSLGQFFREAGAVYTGPHTALLAQAEGLEAALRQLELSTTRTEQTLDAALAEVKAALAAQP